MRPAAAPAHSAPLPGPVARLLTVLADGERLSQLTRARLGDELPIGSVRELAAPLDQDGRVLLAAGDGRAIDRALVRVAAGADGPLRELDVVLASGRPGALYEAVVARAQRERGAARWRSDDAVHPAALWCLPAAGTHPAWALYVSLEGSEVSVRATRESQDCSAL